jgi:hypothetical protein
LDQFVEALVAVALMESAPTYETKLLKQETVSHDPTTSQQSEQFVPGSAEARRRGPQCPRRGNRGALQTPSSGKSRYPLYCRRALDKFLYFFQLRCRTE